MRPSSSSPFLNNLLYNPSLVAPALSDVKHSVQPLTQSIPSASKICPPQKHLNPTNQQHPSLKTLQNHQNIFLLTSSTQKPALHVDVVRCILLDIIEKAVIIGTKQPQHLKPIAQPNPNGTPPAAKKKRVAGNDVGLSLKRRSTEAGPALPEVECDEIEKVTVHDEGKKATLESNEHDVSTPTRYSSAQEMAAELKEKKKMQRKEQSRHDRGKADGDIPTRTHHLNKWRNISELSHGWAF